MKSPLPFADTLPGHLAVLRLGTTSMEESTSRAERGLALLTERSTSGSEPLQNTNVRSHRMPPGSKVGMDQKKTSGQMYSGVVMNFHVLDATSS